MINKEIFDSKKELIIQMMRKGCLLVEIASELEIPLAQLAKLRREYEDINEAITMGETHCAAWWCRTGRQGLSAEKFNFHLFNIFMKNNFGWGDKPSERALAVEEWRGDFTQKLAILDEKLQSGKFSAEQYAHMLKSLTYHAHLQDVVYIAPAVAMMQLEQQKESGEITKEEYLATKYYYDEFARMRRASAEIIFEQEGIQYKDQFKPRAKKSDNQIGKKYKDRIKNTEVVEQRSERSKEFFEKRKELYDMEKARKQSKEYQMDEARKIDEEMRAKALNEFKNDNSDSSEE
jgi:hypothetical protein